MSTHSTGEMSKVNFRACWPVRPARRRDATLIATCCTSCCDKSKMNPNRDAMGGRTQPPNAAREPSTQPAEDEGSGRRSLCGHSPPKGKRGDDRAGAEPAEEPGLPPSFVRRIWGSSAGMGQISRDTKGPRD
eukprot:scaffold431_cov334-Pavlova_lutheri.AAC.74